MEFWRQEIDESMKMLRFLDWSLDSVGLHSLRLGTQRKSRISRTKTELKCQGHVQVSPSRKSDVWVWKLIGDPAGDVDLGITHMKMRLEVLG